MSKLSNYLVCLKEMTNMLYWFKHKKFFYSFGGISLKTHIKITMQLTNVVSKYSPKRELEVFTTC